MKWWDWMPSLIGAITYGCHHILMTYPNLMPWMFPSSFSSKSSISVSCMCKSLMHIEFYVYGVWVCSQLSTWNKHKISTFCRFVPCPDWPSLVNLACFSPGISPIVKPGALSSFLSQHLAWSGCASLFLLNIWLFLNALCPLNPHPGSTQGFICSSLRLHP